jgi:uncharacterized ferredoxin-like protein
MLINERDNREERLLQVAHEMMTAARTAPKGKGFDIIEIALITKENVRTLSDAMLAYYEKTGMKFILRDAENILKASAIIIIGTKQKTHGLNCGYCGFDTCELKNEHPKIPCAINTADVGIAIGSACSVAADHRVDTRVMFSAGHVAQRLNYLPGCSSVYAIPVSCSSKNPFFDRIQQQNSEEKP